MTRKNAQREAFEDALFARIMEGMDEPQVDWDAFMQQLEHDPSADVPQEVHDRMHAFIAQTYSEKKQKKVSKSKRGIISKVLLAAVIAALLLTSALSSSKDLQDTAVKLLIEFTEVAAKLTLGGGGPDDSPVNKPSEEAEAKPGVILMGYQFPALPEGFEVDYQGSYSKGSWIQYRMTDEVVVYYCVDKIGKSTTYMIDTEGASRTETVEINGHEGLLVEKEDWVRLSWFDEEYGLLLTIRCIGFDTKLVLDMAKQCVPLSDEELEKMENEQTSAKPEDEQTAAEPEDKTSGVVLMGYQFPAVPEGFEVEYDGNSSRSAWVQYRDMDGDIIYYSSRDATGLTATVDTENAQRVERIQVNGFDGLLVEKNEKVYLVWTDTDVSRYISILCAGVPTETVLALAEQCVPVGEAEMPEDEQTAAEPEDKTSGVVLMGYQFPAVPEGFEVEFDGDDRRCAWIQYRNIDDAFICFMIDNEATGAYYVDTENAQKVEKIQVNGFDGLLVEKNEIVSLTWVDTENIDRISITCSGFSTKEVFAFAEQCAPVGEAEMPEEEQTAAEPEDKTSGVVLMGYQFPAVPEGFEVDFQKADPVSSRIKYINENGDSIYLAVKDAKGLTHTIDTENAQKVEKIQINGLDGLLIIKNDWVSVVMTDVERFRYIDIFCKGVPKETVLALAEQCMPVDGESN